MLPRVVLQHRRETFSLITDKKKKTEWKKKINLDWSHVEPLRQFSQNSARVTKVFYVERRGCRPALIPPAFNTANWYSISKIDLCSECQLWISPLSLLTMNTYSFWLLFPSTECSPPKLFLRPLRAEYNCTMIWNNSVSRWRDSFSPLLAVVIW